MSDSLHDDLVSRVHFARTPNRRYASDTLHLAFAPTIVGQVVEIHLPKSVTVGRVVGYYATFDGLTRVQLEASEDGSELALEAQTFVIVIVG